MQSISVSLDICISDFCRKNADVNRTQGVCHVIQICFGSSLGKVSLCQILSLLDINYRFWRGVWGLFVLTSSVSTHKKAHLE